ncbi:hypothetical protein [Pseudomonas sp. GM60]|uniref:hypothetical protein n=1 Tax=Pseudomonas sp. GM60 TaxID=1144334 RepID=UPI0002706DF0|nr:hypothetical protein [Pseudomonas sp. GM60]EJM83124.1 hypothetical protein PMI32_02381 [Pseudomonas sp. GM60]
MSLPQTLTYRQRLAELPLDVAALTSDIAAALRPEQQRLPLEDLERVLFEHVNAVAQKIPSCATRLAVWLNLLANARVQAIDHREVEAFVNTAVKLGGPSSVAPA